LFLLIFNFGTVAGKEADAGLITLDENDDDLIIPDDAPFQEPPAPPKSKSPMKPSESSSPKTSSESLSISSYSASSSTEYEWIVELYKVYIYNDHDTGGCGEWKFNIWVNGYRDPSSQYSRCGAGYIYGYPISSYTRTSSSTFDYVFYGGEWDGPWWSPTEDYVAFSKWHTTRECTTTDRYTYRYYYDRSPSNSDVKFYIREKCKKIPPADTTNPPAPSISSSTHPSENIWYTSDDPSFTWNTPYDPSGINGYSYTLTSYSSTPDKSVDTYGNSKNYYNKAEGTYYFNVRARDGAGNWGSADHYRVKIDKYNPPAPSISSSTHPNENTYYSNNDPTFTWNTPSDISGINGYSYSITRSSSTPDTSVDTYGNSKTYYNKGEGTWYFNIRARDGAGRWGSTDHYRIKIDTTDPTINSLNGPDGPTNNDDPYLTWSCSESNCQYKYKLDNGGWTGWTTTTSRQYYNLGTGSHTFYVYAKDSAGNVGPTRSYSWTIDKTKPTISSLNGPSSPTDNDDPSFSWTCSESGCRYKYRLDGGGWTYSWTTSNSKSYSNLDDGSHYFDVKALDAAGNEGPYRRHSWTISTNRDPVINSLEAEFSTVSVGESITVTAAASDPDGDQPLYYNWNKNGGSFSGSTSGSTVTWTAPSTTGTYTISLTVTDGKGGSTGRSVSIEVVGTRVTKTYGDYDGFFVPNEGTQSTPATNRIHYDFTYTDEEFEKFQDDEYKMEIEWVLPKEVLVGVEIYKTNIPGPTVDHAESYRDPGNNEIDIGILRPDLIERGVEYYADAKITKHPSLSKRTQAKSYAALRGLPIRESLNSDDDILILEIELNKWKRWCEYLGIQVPINTWCPQAGDQVFDVPISEGVTWDRAERDGRGYGYDRWPKSPIPPIEEEDALDEATAHQDFITVDSLSAQEFRSLVGQYGIGVLGFELYNRGSGVTVGVFLTDGETIDDGFQKIRDFGTDPSGFEVFSIMADEIPENIISSTKVLAVNSRIHPEEDKWQNPGPSILLTPQSLEIEPGKTGTFEIMVSNPGSQQETYALDLSHIDESWYDLSQTSVTVGPRGNEVVTLSITPPRRYTPEAESYPFRITAESQSNPEISSYTGGSIIVLPLTDVTLPVVKITNPKDGDYVKGEVQIEFTIDEENLESYEVTVNGEPVDFLIPSVIPPPVVPVSWDTTQFEDGKHTIEVTATDTADNLGVASINVTVDNTEPEITITSPETRDYSYTEDVTVEFSAKDAVSGVAYTKATFNGESVTNGQAIDLFGLELGEYTLLVESADNVGNPATKTVTFNVIDDVAPDTKNNADGDWHTIDIPIILTAADEKSSIKEIHYIINDLNEEVITDTDTVHLTIVYEDNDNTITYWAVDEWGNEEEAKTVRGIRLDKTSPVTNTDADAEWHNEDITITLTAVDPQVQGTPSGVAETYYIVYEDGVAAGGQKSVSTDGQPVITYEDDDNRIEYWSIDIAGNEEEHKFATGMKLDKTPPTVTLVLEPQATYYNDEPLPVAYDVYDPIVQGTPSDGVTVAFDIDGTPVEDPTDISAWLGTHILTATATDLAGNSASVSVTFTAVLRADINIDPDTLNLYSNGNWISAYIEFPVGGYDVMTIDVNSLTINGIVPAETNPKYDFVSDPQPADEDGDGVPEFVVKFSRDALREILQPADEVTLTVRGEIPEGAFVGEDTIRVIANGNAKNLEKKADLKVNKQVKALEVDGERDTSKAKIEIDLWAPGGGYVKAVTVREHIPDELTGDAANAAYTATGLVWQMGIVDQKETASYTLELPEVTESTEFTLKTVVEYQTFSDIKTIEKTATLTVSPKGPAKLDRTREKTATKAKGKGYSKVHYAAPSFKGGSESKGKKKGHNKDKGKPENPGNGGDKDNNGKGKK
jgi:hypothetical protein